MDKFLLREIYSILWWSPVICIKNLKGYICSYVYGLLAASIYNLHFAPNLEKKKIKLIKSNGFSYIDSMDEQHILTTISNYVWCISVCVSQQYHKSN